jgi:CO/xanthine dehydrogenase Mo-binding subunit
MALMEEFVPGRTENLHDYLIPTFGDMPRSRRMIVEVTPTRTARSAPRGSASMC